MCIITATAGTPLTLVLTVIHIRQENSGLLAGAECFVVESAIQPDAQGTFLPCGFFVFFVVWFRV